MELTQRHATVCALSFSAALPLLGSEAFLFGPLLFGFYRLLAILTAEYLRLRPLWELLPMAARSQTPERRQQARRDEDKKPLARIKALEKTTEEIKESQAQQRKDTARQGKMLGKAIKTQTQHMIGCETKADKNEDDNATIIKTQGEQGVVLIKLQEVLPWIEQSYADKKARDQMWHKIGDFVGNMVRKNWDSLSGKLIFVALGAILVWRGASWADVLKMFGG